MHGAVTLAGSRGLGQSVSGLNMMEVPDVLPWVRPGEIMVTSGYPLREFSDAHLIELLEGLQERGVSAMIVKVGGRYLDEVGQAVREQAEEMGFPILTMPLDLAFSDLQEAFFSEVLSRHRSALTEETNLRIFGEYLRLILTARPTAAEDELQDTALHLGVHSPEPVRVAVLRGATRLTLHEFRILANELAGHLTEADTHLIMHAFADSLVLVVPEDEVSAVADRLQALSGSRVGVLRGVHVGFGNRADSLTAWRVSYRQAQRALDLTQDRAGGVVHYSTLGLDQVIEALEDRGVAASFMADTLGLLADHPDLVRTLHVALGHSLAIGPTADALHFHYNTVRNRLRRIEELIGPVLQDGRRRAELLIACEIWTRQPGTTVTG